MWALQSSLLPYWLLSFMDDTLHGYIFLPLHGGNSDAPSVHPYQDIGRILCSSYCAQEAEQGFSFFGIWTVWELVRI